MTNMASLSTPHAYAIQGPGTANCRDGAEVVHTPTSAPFALQKWRVSRAIAFARILGCASLRTVEVVLRKVGRKPGRAVVGRLLRAPRKGSVVVIEFPDGLHEYVTTPVKRILRVCDGDVYYLQTANSRYRLEVRSGDVLEVDEAPAAK